jgi:transcription termination/antitermination protein NusA
LLRVDRAAKGPQVIVSRAVPELVQNLFQSEVPEIYDGTVVIRATAREAGERTKIAVMSRDKDVDPVGACVGMKGMRVQSIIRELRGEKIDIIEFSEEITTFAEKALQPAKVSRVSIADLGEKQLEVIVDDTQLSLAIGKKGQNVRLAAKLLGWKIDIKSEEEKRQEVEQQMTGMTGGPTTAIEQVSELGEAIIQKLVAAGITTVEALADMTPEQLEEIPGIGEKTLEKISVAVRHYFGEYEPGEEQAGTTPTAEEDQKRLSEEASLDEEIDALTQDLTQEGEDSVSRDGSGQIFDELAEERLAEITEVGPELEAEGAESLDPGVRDVSERLVEGKPHGLIHGEPIDEDAVLEGNVEEIKDEGRVAGDDAGLEKESDEEANGEADEGGA